MLSKLSRQRHPQDLHLHATVSGPGDLVCLIRLHKILRSTFHFALSTARMKRRTTIRDVFFVQSRR